MAKEKGKKPKKGQGPKPTNKQIKGEIREQLSPQERIDAVRPFWEAQAQHKRVSLLTADLATLKERARQLAELTRQQAVAEVGDHEHLDVLAMGMDTSLEEVLEEGVSRLKQRPTWKLWTWPPDGKDFTDAEAFRLHVIEKHVREELRKYLPRDDPKSPERPAEEGFRKRMQDALARVQQMQQRHYEELAARQPAGSNKEKSHRKGDKGAKGGDKSDKADGKAEHGKGDKDKEKGDKAGGDSKGEKDSKADKDKAGGDKDKGEAGDKADGNKDKDGDKDAAATSDSSSKADKGEGAADGLSKTVSIYRRRRHHAADAAQLAKDNNIEMINVMLEALEQEHEVLYQLLVLPITVYIMEALPEEGRETKDKLELSYEDFDRLLPDDLLHIMEWLMEKVDALTTRLKAEPREDDEPEDEENMGDVDLWALNEEGDSLTVNSKWLQHLQERLLGEDGHPRKVKPGEDPHSNGLVLEWVYGTIVSTAEKARDGAKRPLGSYLPQPNEAHHALVRALEEQYVWDTRLQQARALLADMLKSRLEAAEIGKTYDIKPVPKTAKPEELPADDSLPDPIIVAMLQREVLLTKAKLHYLLWEHITQERQLRTWKSQLKQGEPEFERLKKELDEVKHSHRGLDSTYRSQAEMERHRAQLADAAIEEQLEVQTAFREQGSLLQAIYDKKQRAEYELARKETEIKQLQGWKATVENLIDKFNDLIAAAKGQGTGDEEEGGEAGTLKSEASDANWEDSGNLNSLSHEQHMQLYKLRSHVHKDVRKQLYSDTDDRLFFDALKNEVKAIERRMEEGRVIIQHLEMQLLNVACDDPGIAVGAQLVLPLLQERLDAAGKEFAAERAKLAESEIIRMELEQAAREAAERERKRAVKAAKKDRLKSEKERERADREAREAAEAARRQLEEEQRRHREEEERRKREEALAALRRAEEEAMEARRRELLSDKNGYWHQRMRFEEEQRAAVEAAVASLAQGIDDALVDGHQGVLPAVRQRVDTVDTHRRRYGPPAPAPAPLARRELGHEAVAANMAADKADVKPRAPSPASIENDSKTASDQTRDSRVRPAAEPVADSAAAAAPAQPPPKAAAAPPPAPTTPAPAPPPATMASPAKQVPPGSVAAAATAAAAAKPAAAPAAPAQDSMQGQRTAVPGSVPAVAQRAPTPVVAKAPEAAPQPGARATEPPTVAKAPSAGPAIYFGAVAVPVAAPPAPATQPAAAAPAAKEAAMELRPVMQPHVVRPHLQPVPSPPPPAAARQPSAEPASAAAGTAPQAGPTGAAAPQGPPATGPPRAQPPAVQVPHAAPFQPQPHAMPVPVRPAMPGAPPAQQAAPQQQQGQPQPAAGQMPMGMQMAPPMQGHVRPLVHQQVQGAGAPMPMGMGPRPAGPTGPQAVPAAGSAPAAAGAAPMHQQQHPQHPGAPRMGPGVAPMMPMHAFAAPPPGGVVMPGPSGHPIIVFPHAAAAQAGMLPNGALPGHMMHHPMMGQQHPMLHPHGLPPGLPPQAMALANHVQPPGHAGPTAGPGLMPQQQPPPPQMPPPPPPPAAATAPAAAGGPASVKDTASSTPTANIDSKGSGEAAGSAAPAPAPPAPASDKSLNVAAKPFVPSIAKVVPMPVHVQHVGPPNGGPPANGPAAMGPNPGMPPFGAMLPGQQPVMLQAPQAFPPAAFPPHSAVQGMRGPPPPHVQGPPHPGSRPERGPPSQALRQANSNAGGVRPPQPMHMPASPQQHPAFVMMPQGPPGWDPRTGAPLAMMLHGMAPPHMPGPHVPVGLHQQGQQQQQPQQPQAQQLLQQAPQPGPQQLQQQPLQPPQPSQHGISMHPASHPLPSPGMPAVPLQAPSPPGLAPSHTHGMQQAPAAQGPVPAQAQQQQPSAAAGSGKGAERPGAGAHSPNGPLDRSQASDHSCSSEDGQAQPANKLASGPQGPATSSQQPPQQPQATAAPSSQQQSAQLHVPGGPHTARQTPPPPSAQAPQSQQQLAAEAPGPASSLAAEAAAPPAPSQQPAQSPAASQQPQQAVTNNTASTSSSQTQPQQPRSWSAIAAQDRQGADYSPARSMQTSQAGGPSSVAVTPMAGPSPSQQQQQQAAAAGGSTTTSPGATAAPGSWKHMLQHKLAQAPAPPPTPRWAGTPPVGNFLAAPPSPLNGARLSVTDTGAVVYLAHQGAAPRNLQLIRGLRNGEGEYNCFLNVIIQSLWHLRPFREALLSLPAAAQAGESPSADAQVLQALSSIFRAMATAPSASSAAAAAAQSLQRSSSTSGHYQGGTVSPAALRNALAALGQSAVRVEMSDMHDASEVLGQILECLHRAEASAAANTASGGSPRSGGGAVQDITLPHKVKQSMARAPQPASTVHSLFGLDVQVPCPPEDEEGSGGGSAGGGKRMVRNQRSSSQLSSMQNGPSSGGHAGPAGDKPQAAAQDHVLQFTKFFHLVPAQGLRQAYADALLPSGQAACSWEELLVRVEAAGAASPAVDAEGRPLPTSTLLRRPRVFTVAVVWESPQVPPEAIRSTLAAFGQAVELPAVFRIPPAGVPSWPPGSGSTYTLRAVVCYFGHHYLAFVLSEELGLWLCFDDADISLVGRWSDVCRLMLARRMQPSLLIFEDVGTVPVGNTSSSSA